MTIPALLVDFPAPSSPKYPERAALLGQQWPHCWAVGNVFFRPISTLAFLGYAFTTYSTFSGTSQLPSRGADWRLYAISTVLHFSVILHSAINMQPMNDKLAALSSINPKDKGGLIGDALNAESLMRKWGRWNLVRVVFPLVAGCLAFYQTL
ncbi:hypothetical protein ACMFMG_006031 [Clarireedia jacksonii]